MSVLIGITPAYFSVFTCLFIYSLKAVLKGLLKGVPNRSPNKRYQPDMDERL